MTGFPVIIDCHSHLYSSSIIASVSRRKGLASALGLNMDGALDRIDKSALKKESEKAGVRSSLLLPIAPANNVHGINRLFASTVEAEPALFTAGTLHPAAAGVEEELEWLSSAGIQAIKLCSFSQGFGLEADNTIQLFEKIRCHNVAGKTKFFIVLDTFYQADVYFGAPKEWITTPQRLNRLVVHFPEIDFIAAHMGGLAAPFTEIEENLLPTGNLYLDTSNATHTLSRQEFIRLLHCHGPERILFGTDWPWFTHADEIEGIRQLLQGAGFTPEEQSKIFSGNISRLLGLNL